MNYNHIDKLTYYLIWNTIVTLKSYFLGIWCVSSSGAFSIKMSESAHKVLEPDSLKKSFYLTAANVTFWLAVVIVQVNYLISLKM